MIILHGVFHLSTLKQLLTDENIQRDYHFTFSPFLPMQQT
jgi:hypothetical protein